DRPQFERMMQRLQPGDVVVVCKLDRLARSSRDLYNILHELAEKGCGFTRLGEGWCDTTTDVGRLLIAVMSGVAEFERSLIRKRCQSGIDPRPKASSSATSPSSTSASAARSPSVTPRARRWPNWRPATASPSRRSGARCNSSVTIPVYSVTGPLTPPAEP